MYVEKMSNKYFCTLFDANYLIKGIAMVNSLQRSCPNAYIFILCMDHFTAEHIGRLNLLNIKIIRLHEIESDELLAAKKNRGIAEYCWTLSPCLPYFIINHYKNIDAITYLDADLYFFSSLDPLFEEIKDASIAITEHKFIPRLKQQEIMGKFCVQWVTFQNDEQGLACLARWRQQCIEWCYYRLEDGKMGDQKYLDEWPTLYSKCHIINHSGAGIAPWNFSNYQYSIIDNKIYVDGQPLIFYHFHQFQIFNLSHYDRLSKFYTLEMPEPNEIYNIYEAELTNLIVKIRMIFPNFNAGFQPYLKIRLRRFIQNYFPQSLKKIIHRLIRL